MAVATIVTQPMACAVVLTGGYGAVYALEARITAAHAREAVAMVGAIVWAQHLTTIDAREALLTNAAAVDAFSVMVALVGAGDLSAIFPGKSGIALAAVVRVTVALAPAVSRTVHHMPQDLAVGALVAGKANAFSVEAAPMPVAGIRTVTLVVIFRFNGVGNTYQAHKRCEHNTICH